MTRVLRGPVGVVLVAVLLVSCSDEPRFLRDEATCPGPTCTADARERLETIDALPDVIGVAEVTRSARLDRGSSTTAVVRAGVATEERVRQVGLAVLDVLGAWPDHEVATSLVTVVADPARTVAGVSREAEELAPAFYEPCSVRECEAALAELEQAVEADHAGADVTTRVRGRRLLVSGTAPREEAALAARGAVRVLRELGLRVAATAQVAIRWRGPLALTLRLEDGLVCEQPPGVQVACEPGNSTPLAG